MMRQQTGDQSQLFYLFNLEERIPAGHQHVAAGTPAPIIDKLNALTVAALKMPDIIAKMKLQGLHPLSSTPVGIRHP